AALGHVLVEPGLLDRVQPVGGGGVGGGEAFDGGDLVGGLDLGDGDRAGVEGEAVDVAGAGLAHVEAAAVFGAGDAEQVAEHPEHPQVGRRVDGDGFPVEDERV